MIWYVVFHPGRTIWSRHWKHVSLLGYCDDTWISLDLNRARVSITAHHSYDDWQDVLTYHLHYHKVVRFGPRRGGGRSYFSPMMCVSFVKHVLGVRSSALRPDGLLRSLVEKYGAEEVHEAVAAQGNERAEAAAQGSAS